MSVFHAYDIRAIVGEEKGQLNEEVAYKIGFVLAKYSGADNIMVAMDARTHSKMLKDSLVNGITDAGSNVMDIGMYSTPYLFSQVGIQKGEFGVMVTASHNTKEYNGFKIFSKGPTMLYKNNGLKEIESMMNIVDFTPSKNKGVVESKEIISDYINHHNKFWTISNNKKIKIVIDAANGVGFLTAKEFFKDKENIEIIEMYTNPDGNFPNHEANPVKFSTLGDLQEKVKKEQANLGVAYDGDGDRVIFVDEMGEIIMPDQIGALLAEHEVNCLESYPVYIKEKKKNKIFYIDLRFSKAIKTYLEKYGVKVERVQVGNPYYKEKLQKNGGLLAAEFSGHIMFPENYNADDALFATIKVLEIIASGANLHEKKKELSIYYQTEELNYKVADANQALENIKSTFEEHNLSYLDGVTVESKDGWWFNVRKSNTEPLVRVRVEGKGKYEVDPIVDKIKKAIGVD